MAALVGTESPQVKAVTYTGCMTVYTQQVKRTSIFVQCDPIEKQSAAIQTEPEPIRKRNAKTQARPKTNERGTV